MSSLRWPIFALLLLASVASAQEDRDERARLHFNSGRSYFDEGNYERALQEFQEAYSLSPRSPMLFNIGTTQERLNLLDDAANTFEQYLREVPTAENRDNLERRVVNLRRRAEELRRNPNAVMTNPTTTTTATTTTTTGGGGGNDGLMIGGIAALATGGAALIGFVITGSLALSAQSSVQGGCYATHTCTPSDVSGMDTLALVSDILWPVGLAAAGVGAVLLILGITSSSSPQASVSVVPVAWSNGGGVVIGGAL